MNTGLRIQPQCGGPAITLGDDGYIVVDGLGTIKRKWAKGVDQWRDLIRTSADRWGVPEAWIAGVMCQESAGIQHALSSAGCIGLMQICNPIVPISKEDLWKPANNIDMGARILATHAKKAKWDPVQVAGLYNDGGTCYAGKNCDYAGLWLMNENCGYCEQVVRGINTAIDNGYSGIGASEPPSDASTLTNVAIAVGSFAVIVGAMMVAGVIQPPSFLRNVVPVLR